jgi:hypothetical protein
MAFASFFFEALIGAVLRLVAARLDPESAANETGRLTPGLDKPFPINLQP